jgi:hypothetical protein
MLLVRRGCGHVADLERPAVIVGVGAAGGVPARLPIVLERVDAWLDEHQGRASLCWRRSSLGGTPALDPVSGHAARRAALLICSWSIATQCDGDPKVRCSAMPMSALMISLNAVAVAVGPAGFATPGVRNPEAFGPRVGGPPGGRMSSQTPTRDQQKRFLGFGRRRRRVGPNAGRRPRCRRHTT